MRSWVKPIKLEDMTSMLPSGTLCFYKEKVESVVASMMPTAPLKELYTLYSYIQHLILESKYDYEDEEFDNFLDEENLLLQTRGKYMKFVIYHPQLLQNQDTLPIKACQFQKRYKKGRNCLSYA